MIFKEKFWSSGSTRKKINRMKKGQTRIEHFMSLVSVKSESECWVFLGPKTEKNYGVYIDNEHGIRTAHRYSYFLFYKQHPGKKFVCHKCDNPSCVNPNHLWLGNVQENNKDKVEKNRQKPGIPKFSTRSGRFKKFKYIAGL